MRSTRRRASLVGFAAAALAIGIGSYAWACTPNAHTGLFWFCNVGSNCNFGVGSPNNVSASTQKWGKASGLTAGVSYDLNYAAGSHIPTSDSTCDLSGTIFTGGANLTANGSGNIGPVTLTMPGVVGTYTKCAFPGGYNGNVPTSVVVATHSLFTVS